ncbi:Uncharacterized protein APZ42_027984 [Daphnia magna]|uniref:Uncharacterized protein n=1 Tax=Daphnia magna TaxID=35525 RepID=A0A164QX57_9CRUS|nr:Uncharacterized protein APZ42_027984 [Daphnia magna]
MLYIYPPPPLWILEVERKSERLNCMSNVFWMNFGCTKQTEIRLI